jgi:LuxR family maltose regulon positive regulatory protein
MCLYTIELLQGCLQNAEEKFNNLLKLAKRNGMWQLGISGSICASLGIILFLRGLIKEGMSYIEQGIEMAESGKDALALAGCKLNLLQALFVAGDYEGARKTLEHIEEIGSEFNIPPWMTHTISAWRGRIYLAKDELESASKWVSESGLDIKGQLTNRNEFEYLVFARYLYIIGKNEEALSLLNRMQKNAESSTRMMAVTQILILKALILYGNNEMNKSVDALRQALFLAEGTGFIGIFQSEGKYLSELLEYAMENEDLKIKIDHHSLSESYLKKLQLALRAKPQLRSDALVEQLSDREIDVLNLISLGLTNQQIAEHLFISLNTVKTHLKNINLKLNSHNRTQAIAKAKDLGILS